MCCFILFGSYKFVKQRAVLLGIVHCTSNTRQTFPINEQMCAKYSKRKKEEERIMNDKSVKRKYNTKTEL